MRITEKPNLTYDFETIFSALPDAVAIMDESGKIINVNESYMTLFGASKGDLIGKMFLHFESISNEVRHCLMTQMFAELRARQPVRFETLVTTSKGPAKWAKVTATLLECEGQTLCLASLHDINDRRRMEVALRMSGEKSRRIFQSVSDAIIVTDLSGVITEVNEKALEMFGHSREQEVTGKYLAELNDTDPEELERVFQAAVNHGAVAVGSVLRHADGTERFLEVNISDLRASEETRQGFVFILRDVTRKKENEDLHRRLVTASPVGIYIAQTGKFRFVNPKFAQLSGYSKDELLRMATLDLVHPEDRQKVRERAISMLKGKVVPLEEFRIIDKDGEIHWAMETISPIIYHGTKASLSNFIDMTERHQADIALHKALDASERSRMEVMALLEASRSVLAHPVFKEAASAVLQICKRITGASSGVVTLVNETGNKYETLTTDTDGVPVIVGDELSAPVRILRGDVYASGNAVYENDLRNSHWAEMILASNGVMRNVILAPLAVDGKHAGLVMVGNKPEGFTESDVRLVAGLTNFVTIALSNVRAWESLTKSENRYRDLYSQAPIAFFAVDTKGLVQTANNKAVELLGYSMNELISMPMVELYAESRFGREKARALAILLTYGKVISGEEVEMRRKDGARIWVSLSVEPVRNDDGSTSGSRIAALDITDRKEAELALEVSQARFWELADLLPLSVWETNTEGRFLYTNKETLKSYGIVHQEADQMNMFDRYVPEDRARAKSDVAETISRKETLGPREYTSLRKDGTTFPVLVYTAPIVHSGEVSGLRGISIDITERKQLDAELLAKIEELQDANRRLKDLDKLKDNFLSTVSHELRTPLTSIKSFAEILLAYDDDKATQREFLTIINDESERLTRLINDFLDLSKIQSGRMQWETKEVFMPSVIESALHATNSLVSKNSLVVSTNIESDLPPIIADRDRLIQVVTNLLSNAIKFTPEGGKISVTAERKTTCAPDADTEMLTVSISDSGIGIAPEHFKHIFEKFTQVGDILQGRPKGTGLGLPICKEIVEHYGGSIWVESELGKGSIFRFSLPVKATLIPAPVDAIS